MGLIENLYERRQRLVESLVLGVALPAVAGAVNAAGFLVIGTYTSHVTGMAARSGDEVALGHWFAAWQPLALIAAFFGGAFFAAVLTEIARRRGHARYVIALIAEAIFISLFAVICAATPQEAHVGNFALAAILSAAMGLQNALVTRISGAVVRTTHMTGVITDLGVESARIYYLLRQDLKGKSMGQQWTRLKNTWGDAELKRLVLLTTIFVSFLAGAVIGPLVFLQAGYWSVAVPCAILLGLAFVDWRIGLDWHPEVHLVPAGRPSNPRFLQMVAAEAAAHPEKARQVAEMLRAREHAVATQAEKQFEAPVVLDVAVKPHAAPLPKAEPQPAEALTPKA
ncbi:MAG: DUF1275 domain-containing protein [Planctomycetes bacterium]|nr:DUF1275 domain-containing protein [Planctomycetota bacterium]